MEGLLTLYEPLATMPSFNHASLIACRNDKNTHVKPAACNLAMSVWILASLSRTSCSSFRTFVSRIWMFELTKVSKPLPTNESHKQQLVLSHVVFSDP